MKHSLLSIKNLTVSVNSKKIIDKFSFEFEKGKIYVIMGPNGSGKSTLAYSLMGHQAYRVKTNSKIIYGGENLLNLSPEKRAEKGIFLSFQSPLSLNGVRVNQLLQYALNGKKGALQVREEIEKVAKELHVKENLLNRSLNEGASGGERKKMEVLQAAVLDKDLMIFDEIDTGVDVDGLKLIARFLEKNKKDKTYIIITHYNRILKYLKPDKVLILTNGKLQRVGDSKLADEVEKNGYET